MKKTFVFLFLGCLHFVIFGQTKSNFDIVFDQDFIIHENCDNGDYIGRIKLIPVDTFQNLNFQLAEGDTDVLAIDTGTGVLTVKDAGNINWDVKKELSVKVGILADWKEYQIDKKITATIKVLDDEYTIFVDPGSATNGSGTKADPKNTFAGITYTDSTNYLLKRGTLYDMPYNINLSNLNNLVFAAYGQGSRPEIRGDANFKNFNITGGVKNIVIRDLKLSSDNWGTVGVSFQGEGNENGQVIDCEVTETFAGIRYLANVQKKMKVLYCDLHHLREDGIFGEPGDDIEIAYSKIYDVNLNWVLVGTEESQSPGDCVQFGTTNNLHVHHNYLDRGTTGNKFAFINFGHNDDYICVFENNYVRGPIKGSGAVMYLHSSTNYILNNYLVGSDITIAVGGGDNNNIIAGNIIAGSGIGINNRYAEIYNNVFYDIRTMLNVGTYAKLRNNIFYLTQSGDIVFGYGQGLDSDYNCYNTEQTGMFVNKNTVAELSGSYDIDKNSIVGDPKFIDPASLDFRISESSPCIDRGSPVDRLFDMFMTPIPQNNIPDIGAHEYFTVLSTRTGIDKTNIQINPNPSDGLIYINLGDISQQDVHIKIIDITGRVLLTENFSSRSGIIQFNLAPFKQKIYFIQVIAGGEILTTERILKM